MLEPEGIIDDLVVDPLTEEWALKLEGLCDRNCDKCKNRVRCQKLWDRIANVQKEDMRKNVYKKLWPEIQSLIGAK